MQTTLLGASLLCLIAAIVGGGVKMAGGEIPALASGWRQLMLGAFGVILLVWAANTGGDQPSAGEQSATRYTAQDLDNASSEVRKLERFIADKDGNDATLRSAITVQNDLLDRQQRNLDGGAGSRELRAEVEASMTKAREAVATAQATVDQWKRDRPDEEDRLRTLTAERDRIRAWLEQHP